MSTTKIVIPTITAYSLNQVIEEAQKYLNYFDTIHFDVIDLSYGNPTYFDEVEVITALSKYKNIVMHLMVQNPSMFLVNKKETLLKNNITFILPNKKVGISNILALQKLGFNIGLSYELGEKPTINTEIISTLKEIMFLPIIPGKTGQTPQLSFLSIMESFINEYKVDMYSNITISIDGGFNRLNAHDYLLTNASVIYANSFFKKTSLQQTIEELRNLNAYINNNLTL